MDVAISSDLLARILSDAAATPAVEVCGLLLGTPDRIVAARACLNVADDPARSFEIDPRALFAAHRAARDGGAAVVGCYHSHPTGFAAPSSRDAANAMGDGALWMIVAGGAARLWRTAAVGSFVEQSVVADGL